MQANGPVLVQYQESDPVFRIWNVADIHYGNAGCAEGQLAEDAERIGNDPYSLAIIGGDYLDAIPMADKRFDPRSLRPEFRARDLGSMWSVFIGELVSILAPMRGPRLLGIAKGNHEVVWMNRNVQEDCHPSFCKAMGAPNLEYSGRMELWFRRCPQQRAAVQIVRDGLEEPRPNDRVIRLAYHHGCGGAATPSGKTAAMQRLLALHADADVLMCGHLHEQMSHVRTQLTAPKHATTIGAKQALTIMSGGYLRAYAEGQTSYAEMRGYAPTTIGSAALEYRPLTRDARPSTVAKIG